MTEEPQEVEPEPPGLPSGRWTVSCRPVDDSTTATARPALAVRITDGVDSIDIAHIAFVRRQGKNKGVDFGAQLQLSLDVGQEAVDTINEFEQYLEELRQEQVEMARKRVGMIVGKVSLAPL